MIKITREIEVSDNSLAHIHDRIWDIFHIHVTHDQIAKLLELDPDYDGTADTHIISDLMNVICDKFIGMDIPTYGSSEDYKQEFWAKVEIFTDDLVKFIS